MRIIERSFGKTEDGRTVTAFDLSGEGEMTATVIDLGAAVQSVKFPGSDGILRDVALGYDDADSYLKGSCYYGAVVGRYANRIGGGSFTLGGKRYDLIKNEPHNHVHGVFPKRFFKASIEGGALVMRYLSPDMEEGFPGNLELEVTYRIREDDSLEISYKARSDAPTPINLTNHSYFNLNGQDGSTVLDHKVRLNCSYFTEYAPTFAQTGRIIPVDGTPLDFRRERAIGERFKSDYEQFRICTGYDHNMVLDGEIGALKEIGIARSDKTGIELIAFTTEPAIQFYSANYITFDPVPWGKSGIRYPKNGGFCFEAQHYPDSLNHPEFPSTVLYPGEEYTQKTVYRLRRFK